MHTPPTPPQLSYSNVDLMETINRLTSRGGDGMWVSGNIDGLFLVVTKVYWKDLVGILKMAARSLLLGCSPFFPN